MSRKRKQALSDEPPLDDDEWVEWGGELIWAAGFTSGGAPYGLSVDEFRAGMKRETPRAGWVRAKRILSGVFDSRIPTGASVDVGRVRYLEEGLFRKGYWAHVDIYPDPGESSGRYVVLLPQRDTDSDFDARVTREATILARLAEHHLPFRTPRVIAVAYESTHPVLVESFVSGIPLDLRAGRQARVKPWQVVGELAAAIHSLDTAILKDAPVQHRTRRDHAATELRAFEGLDDPLFVDALAWAQEHVPPPTPSTFVHGDLLGQNILLPLPDESTLPGVIDWEFAQLGDPALDLAVVTRGVRRPFQIDRGLDKLLDSYRAAGGAEIEATDVSFYELCMTAHWYRDSLDPDRRIHPTEHELKRMRGVLRRAIERS